MQQKSKIIQLAKLLGKVSSENCTSHKTADFGLTGENIQSFHQSVKQFGSRPEAHATF